MMEEQLERSRAETEGIHRMKEKVEAILKTVANEVDELMRASDIDSEKDTKMMQQEIEMEESRRIWEALRNELDT